MCVILKARGALHPCPSSLSSAKRDEAVPWASESNLRGKVVGKSEEWSTGFCGETPKNAVRLLGPQRMVSFLGLNPLEGCS